MRYIERFSCFILLLTMLTLAGVFSSATPCQAGSTATGSMTMPRDFHTATQLQNGKTLIAGGGGLHSAELFDPTSGTFTATGSMATLHNYHTATLLPSGKVLIVGGFDGYSGALASAELYDPTSGTFTVTGSMATARGFHTATLLPNGKVLIVGGYDGVDGLASAELYDPTSGTFTATGNMATTRGFQTATLLQSGKVLIVGGYDGVGVLASAELYDPTSGTFTATGSMATVRAVQTATLLQSGKVLIVGGYDGVGVLASAELYDPTSGTFTATGNMAMARRDHTATLLPSGKILVAGGHDSLAVVYSSVELYDPSTNAFTITGIMTTERTFHTATLLPNGKVLIAGGDNNPVESEDGGYSMDELSSAELYDPSSETVITSPGAPIIGTAIAGNGQVAVTFSAPLSNGGGAITRYTAIATPGNITATGTESPITVTGLTIGTTYTFTVTATNVAGTGPASAASNSLALAPGLTSATTFSVSPKIAAGDSHIVTLMSDGTVKAWGNNLYGQLGNGTVGGYSSTPVTVTGLGGTITAIAAGYMHTVALMSDGTVKAWGNNESGQLGDVTVGGYSSTPVTVTGLGGTVTAIAAGGARTVALMSDGTVKVWGSNSGSSTPVTVTGLGGTVTAIAAGNAHTVALMSDGTVKAWGDNKYGQLGDGTTTDSSTPVTVTGLGGTVTAIAAGSSYTVALMSDGTVKKWGLTPVTVTGLGGTVTAIAAGYMHTVALMSNGTVKAWGNNESGQLGNGTTDDNSPVTVTRLGGTVTAIAAGRSYTVALMSDGTVKAWGKNDYGQLGNGTTTPSRTPVTVAGLGGTVTTIVAGSGHTVALMSDGTVKAWGNNHDGRLGDGTTISSSTPVNVTGLGGAVTAIAAGGGHTVALMSNGTVKTWGNNDVGQLGNGTTYYNSTPIEVTGLGGTVTAIAAGGVHTVVLKSDGTLWAWGNNDYGQLGTGSTYSFARSHPVMVTGLGGTVTAIAAGGGHTVALMSDGTVKAWGKNDQGQLGNDTLTNSSTPVTVTGLGGTVTAIAAGGSHTVALMSDGTVKAWGNGDYGTIMGLGGAATAIAAGGAHTVALMSDGTVKAWGYNYYGQLGNGIIFDSYTPVTVMGLGGTVTAIGAGGAHTVALMSDGTVKAWGDNVYGQLGDGKSGITPTAALNNLDVTAPTTSNYLLAGSYTGSQTLQLACNDNYSGCSRIYYTIDGSDPVYPPTGSTMVYDSYITLSDTTTLRYFSRDMAGNCEPIQSRSYTIISEKYPLSVTLSGFGTVNSTPSGIACQTGSVAGCAAQFTQGTPVTLLPTPSTNASFAGWSGACTGSGGCQVTMNSAQSVTATFTPNPAMVKVSGDGTPFYAIDPALDAVALPSTVVSARDQVFTENVIMTSPVSIRLLGGYTDVGFTTRTATSHTTIDGSLKVRGGTLRVERITVR